MQAEKLERLEEKFYKIENQVARLDWEIKWKLDSIEKLLLKRDNESWTIITQIEKQKVNEKRLSKLEEANLKLREELQKINLKIAMFSWGWAVVVYIISKIN